MLQFDSATASSVTQAQTCFLFISEAVTPSVTVPFLYHSNPVSSDHSVRCADAWGSTKRWVDDRTHEPPNGNDLLHDGNPDVHPNSTTHKMHRLGTVPIFRRCDAQLSMLDDMAALEVQVRPTHDDKRSLSRNDQFRHMFRLIDPATSTVSPRCVGSDDGRVVST